MGRKWVHEKPEPVNIRGTCVLCNKKPQERMREGRYRSICSRCNAKQRGRPSRFSALRPYTLHKKDHCEKCGFKPEHPCQLDVDHIDGDHDNDAEGNHQTLCANCHRLKTYKQRYSEEEG